MADEEPSAPGITFLSGSLAGRHLALTQRATTVGSDPTCEIVAADPGVAPRHVRLVRGDTVWRVERMEDAGPISVNGRAVEGAVLQEGAVITLSAACSLEFTTRPAAAPHAAPSLARGERRTGEQRRVTGPNETEIAPLSLLSGSQAGIEVKSDTGRQVFPLGATITDIGRDPANDIVLDSRIVSARHLRIEREGKDLMLVHPHPDRAKTLNGLLYQGRQIAGDERFRKVLANGDVFRIGSDEGTVLTLTYFDGTGAPQAVPPVEPIKLGEPVLTIGRRADNRIVLPHPQVSALHAMLVREEGAYRLLDQNSSNHVYVNGEPVTNRVLALGDEIRIGPYRLVYQVNQLTQYDESQHITVNGIALHKTGTNDAILLNDISISIPPRQFVALVGGSGAGKSTLMDALNGLRPASGGRVLYNGEDLYEHRGAFAGQLGYVPQDDIIHRDLTVERALYYTARLRLPSDFTEQQIEQRIKEVLDDVEMTPRRHLLVKKLSGGQRKRVSIALELLANPSVFFLDEPTSGLDPGLDRKMMYLLRKLADKGHTVVLVTHATNNIKVCDYVCFLAQGGRLTYFGPPDEAMDYFGKADFAEIYTSLEATDEDPDIPAKAEARFKESPAYQRYVATPLTASTQAPEPPAAAARPRALAMPRRGNPLRQFALLTRRNLELLWNNKTNLVLLLLQAPLMAIVVMALIRFEVGSGLFDRDKVVECAPQIVQTVVSTTPTAANPSGTVRLGIDTTHSANPNAPVDCAEIHKLLSGDPTAKADASMLSFARDYTRLKGHGNVNQALQDFIIAGDTINTLSAIFIIAFIAVLFGCINGTREIVKEGSIYRRERAVNLGILPYVFSKVAIMGALAVLQSAALLIVIQLFEPFQVSIFLPVLLEVFITLLLTGLAGLMMGLAVSAFAANEDSANSLLPFILVPQVVFAGAQFPLKDIPLQVLGMIFPVRWTMIALGSTIGMHSDKLSGDRVLGSDPSFHGTLYSTFSKADATQHVLLAWGALGLTSIVLAVAVCLALRAKDVGRAHEGAGWLARRLARSPAKPEPLAVPATPAM